MLYAYPYFGRIDLGYFRIGGAGLGNILFPWSRAVLACDEFGLVLIEPTWSTMKFGPILRGEIDKRNYNTLFQPANNSLRGIKKIKLLVNSRRIDETKLKTLGLKKIIADNYELVEFKGLKNYFWDIRHKQEIVLDKLIKISRPEHLVGIKDVYRGTIGIHIRRGDFSSFGRDTSMDWFIDALRMTRKMIGKSVKANIYSDSDSSDLIGILAEDNISLVNHGSALADLLSLSCHSMLIGSANSTFSMWASYLGQMPSIWPRNHNSKGEGKSSKRTHSVFPENMDWEELIKDMIDHSKNMPGLLSVINKNS